MAQHLPSLDSLSANITSYLIPLLIDAREQCGPIFYAPPLVMLLAADRARQRGESVGVGAGLGHYVDYPHVSAGPSMVPSQTRCNTLVLTLDTAAEADPALTPVVQAAWRVLFVHLSIAMYRTHTKAGAPAAIPPRFNLADPANVQLYTNLIVSNHLAVFLCTTVHVASKVRCIVPTG